MRRYLFEFSFKGSDGHDVKTEEIVSAQNIFDAERIIRSRYNVTVIWRKKEL